MPHEIRSNRAFPLYDVLKKLFGDTSGNVQIRL
jgi:hypothetical protein